MSDTVIIGRNSNDQIDFAENQLTNDKTVSTVPDIQELESNLSEASKLVDDIILKKYLHKLTDYKIIPLDNSLKQISDIRIFKITEMVYQNNEYSTYKFASVFSAVQNLNCGVFIIVDSDGSKTNFYMGVRSLDNVRTTKSLKDTLKNALCGQFPGVKTKDLLDSEAEQFLSDIPSKNVVSVSCVAKNKNLEFKNNDSFIQGLEKLAIAMQGQKYTTIILAKSTPTNRLEETREAYESIYSSLSPFANMQLSYGSSSALSISNALSHGSTKGTSYSKNQSKQHSTSISHSETESSSVSKTNTLGSFAKAIGNLALGIASVATAPMTGGASIAAAGTIMAGQVAVNSINPKTSTKGTTISKNHTESESISSGESFGESENTSKNETKTEGKTLGTSNTMQLNMQNKTLLDTLAKIDLQLKRIDECESVGMWECAAYFLSDSQETAEMAAGTYKALMKGEQSGVESSAINFWGRMNKEDLPILREYITNFLHPIFEYRTSSMTLPVTATSLVSSNELAIQMGLPRKSVCGFPVIEHAEFGREVVSYDSSIKEKDFTIGNIFSMGEQTDTRVKLDCNSLAMHTFITGSTGSGKSNTVYEILNQLYNLYDLAFLVIEPAKGEYKNVFGQYPDVMVYGTNPKKTELLRINPFRFPSDVHVLEHLDRLVEIFNVCWPMYAAMPAILKEAMERAYIEVGWDLRLSENRKGDRFPNFVDLLEQIEKVINESKYSADSKGDYSGALLTRVRSLTNGLNGLIFTNSDLDDSDIFDKKVIIDLSRVGSTETKSLIMGLLIMKLNEYRMTSGKINSPLSHITVLEEAHNLLKRTSTEQISEGSNLLGKSVELLSNSIAEMRTYGEGFIIADQTPGLLDMSVIKNTNTKIILRLPERQDRELVGYAAGLNEAQIEELAKLKKGVAAIYQNDWIEPVLVQINKCQIKENNYQITSSQIFCNTSNIKNDLINFLIQGRLNEKLDFNVDLILNNIAELNLSSSNQYLIENLIHDFKNKGYIELWNDDKFNVLSKIITQIFGTEKEVEKIVLKSKDNYDLTMNLVEMVKKMDSEITSQKIITLIQCFMKNMSEQNEENIVRKRIYLNWLAEMKERGLK